MDLKEHYEKIKELTLSQNEERGYGGAKEKYKDPILPKFKTIVYEKGPYLVIDRYTGQERNMGQAITFHDDKPVKGLNYYGIIVNEDFERDEVFDFLKEALRAGTGETLYRGLDGYERGKYSYQNNFTEERGFMEGEEKILYDGKAIYIQIYHGGMIEDREDFEGWSDNLEAPNKLKERLRERFG